MRAEWTFLAGLAVGGAGAFAALSAAQRDVPHGPAAPHADTAAPAGSAFPETVATLRPVEPTPERTIPARGTPAGAAVVDVDLADFAELVATNPKGEQPSWVLSQMLARTYARAGRADALRKVLSAAIAAGESPAVLVGWIAVLPEERRVAALEAFLRDHPETKAFPGALAWAWFNAGDASKAFPLAVEQLTAVKGQDPALLARMYAVDADRADGAAWRLAHEQDWSVVIPQVMAAAASAGRGDLVARWQEWLVRQQGPSVTVASAEPTKDQLRQAASEAEQQTRESPDDADAWAGLAHAREAAGEHRGAVDAWRTAIEKAGPEADYLRAFLQVDPAAAFGTIEALAREAQEDDVLLVFVEACLRVGKPEEAGAAFFRMHSLENAEWLHAGIASLAPSAALSRMERLLSHRQHRQEAAFRIARADALLALGRLTAAYDEYLRLDEDGFGGRVREALTRADPARAAARFEAMRTGPEPDDSDELAALHALALMRAGRADAARAVAEPVLARWEGQTDRYDDGLRWLGLVLPERTLALTRALAEAGFDGTREITAGLLVALGRAAEARPIYDKLLADDPQNHLLLLGRGRCR